MIRPIYVHCRPSAEGNLHPNSVMKVNGSVAVLNRITETLLGYPGLAIDETYMGSVLQSSELTHLQSVLVEEIERSLSRGDQPVIFCSLVSYNAERSLRLLSALKRAYGRRIRTGVGGQLTRFAPEAYLGNANLDHVGVGDAEVILRPLLEGGRYAAGYKMVSPRDHYASPQYANYLGLEERLEAMSHLHYGPFTGIRQLVTESVRGCAWATAYRICKFCSLQAVDTRPLFRDLSDHFRIERELAVRYGCNWIFDVSNQWLPVVGPRPVTTWLREYIEAQHRCGAAEINRYVYLTANSITERSAPLLREAGVRAVFVGLDGWDRATRRALYKPDVPSSPVLQVCQRHGLYVRTAVVIGSGLTRENLRDLPAFVEDTLHQFGDVILSLATFLEVVLPGSEDWETFERMSVARGITEAIDLFKFFRVHGYHSPVQEARLSELRIRHQEPAVAYEELVAARDKTAAIIERYGVQRVRW